MMRKLFCTAWLFVLPLGATEYTLDPQLYQEALHEVQGGQGKEAQRPAIDDLRSWQSAMDLLESARLEQQLQGKQALLLLFKKYNRMADDADLAQVITLHEQAIAGELKACMRLGLALLKGEDGALLYPQSKELALIYLEAVYAAL